MPCARGAFDAWITPHGEAGDPDARRAENVRLLAEGEQDFARLYEIRNDSQAFTSAFERSLLVKRAMGLGWRRQLLDAVCFALLSNAVVAHRAAETDRHEMAAGVPIIGRRSRRTAAGVTC